MPPGNFPGERLLQPVMARSLFARPALSFLILLLSAVPGWAAPGHWVPLDIRSDREAPLASRLETGGVRTISWSTAQVEVSAFDGTETVALASLKTRLAPQDPRWDPWLTSLSAVFQPRPGVSRLWVEDSRRSQALGILGSEVLSSPGGPRTPLAVTGWGLAGFALLYFFLKLAAVLSSAPAVRKAFRSWRWVPVPLVLATAGLVLAVWGAPSAPVEPARPGISWVHHRWFQESWPYGAAWENWVPGKPWTYRSFVQTGGRLAEVSAPLPVPDGLWAGTAFTGLDSHHAARIFGPENP